MSVRFRAWQRFLSRMSKEQRKKIMKDTRAHVQKLIPYLKQLCTKEGEWRYQDSFICGEVFGSAGPLHIHALDVAVKWLRRQRGPYKIFRDRQTGFLFRIGSDRTREETERKWTEVNVQGYGLLETASDIRPEVENAEQKELRLRQAVRVVRDRQREIPNIV